MRIDANNRMVMIRGETERITAAWPGEPFASGDVVHFTVSRSYADSPSLHIEVSEFTDGTAVIDIPHSATASMDVGAYVYDIRVIRSDGTYQTIMKGKKDTPPEFFLIPEVTK